MPLLASLHCHWQTSVRSLISPSHSLNLLTQDTLLVANQALNVATAFVIAPPYYTCVLLDPTGDFVYFVNSDSIMKLTAGNLSLVAHHSFSSNFLCQSLIYVNASSPYVVLGTAGPAAGEPSIFPSLPIYPDLRFCPKSSTPATSRCRASRPPYRLLFLTDGLWWQQSME